MTNKTSRTYQEQQYAEKIALRLMRTHSDMDILRALDTAVARFGAEVREAFGIEEGGE